MILKYLHNWSNWTSIFRLHALCYRQLSERKSNIRRIFLRNAIPPCEASKLYKAHETSTNQTYPNFSQIGRTRRECWDCRWPTWIFPMVCGCPSVERTPIRIQGHLSPGPSVTTASLTLTLTPLSGTLQLNFSTDEKNPTTLLFTWTNFPRLAWKLNFPFSLSDKNPQSLHSLSLLFSLDLEQSSSLSLSLSSVSLSPQKSRASEIM